MKTERDFELIRAMVQKGLLQTIGIAWVRSILTWSWVYYYKYSTR